MGRPFTASDSEILQAAGKVIGRRGPEAFSIAEVASEVGLSRAAIILRFKSTHALKVASMTTMMQYFVTALDTLPKSPSGDNVLRLAAFIGSWVHSRESSARFFSNYTANIHDRELTELEVRRGEALNKAISNVMPESAIDHDSAVTAFCAHLTGSIIAWIGLGGSDSRGYVVMRTGEWLKLARIPFSAQVIEELSTPPSTASATASESATPRRSKAARATKRARPRLKSAAAGR
jgi:TetR/AcrR family macrolide resistance operon transcriptional repressor